MKKHASLLSGRTLSRRLFLTGAAGTPLVASVAGRAFAQPSDARSTQKGDHMRDTSPAPENVDVVIVGASFAGLAAAMQLGRTRRPTLLLDGGPPRNAASPAAHGVPGFDGARPADILHAFRAQLAPYAGVTITTGRVSAVSRTAAGFDVHLEQGATVRSKKVILATGVRDKLPDLPGAKALWGRSVLHCPYCHGYEVRDRRLGVIALNPSIAAHQAKMLITDWSRDVVLFTNGEGRVEHETLRALAGLGVRVETSSVIRLNEEDGQLQQVLLEDGRAVPLDAVFMAPPTEQRSPLAEQLGCTMINGGNGPLVAVDDATGETDAPGIYAAGDMARAAHTVAFAMSDGVRAGIMAHQALLPNTA